MQKKIQSILNSFPRKTSAGFDLIRGDNGKIGQLNESQDCMMKSFFVSCSQTTAPLHNIIQIQ